MPKQVAEEASDNDGSRWKYLKHTVLVWGGIIGAVTAILTIPSVGHSIWKNGLELRDRMTSPDIKASVDRFSIRCAVQKPATDVGPLLLEKHCDIGALGISVLFGFANEDFIPRSIKSLKAKLELFDALDNVTEHLMDWPRLVSHQTINGTDSVVWSEWSSIDFGARESETQEILFTSKHSQPQNYGKFRKAIYNSETDPAWTEAKITITAEFIDTKSNMKILECKTKISPKYIQFRIDNPQRQNQITLPCINILN